MKKRWSSLLLVLALCLSLAPAALAAEQAPGLYWDGVLLTKTEGTHTCTYQPGVNPNHTLRLISPEEITDLQLNPPHVSGVNMPQYDETRKTVEIPVFLPEYSDFTLTMTVTAGGRETVYQLAFSGEIAEQAHPVQPEEVYPAEPPARPPGL